jgi:hypothetical protein
MKKLLISIVIACGFNAALLVAGDAGSTQSEALPFSIQNPEVMDLDQDAASSSETWLCSVRCFVQEFQGVDTSKTVAIQKAFDICNARCDRACFYNRCDQLH